MKTSMLALAIALAFSLTATPADATDDLAKCRVSNAKIKMNYAKCLELDNLLGERGKAPKGVCESKRLAALQKATAKFVTKLHISADDCGIDLALATKDQVRQLFASGVALTELQIDALTADDTIGAIATNAARAVCLAAGGVWPVNGHACNLPATPVANLDCFRVGACGAEGVVVGTYASYDAETSGCDATHAGETSYSRGRTFFEFLEQQAPPRHADYWQLICASN